MIIRHYKEEICRFLGVTHILEDKVKFAAFWESLTLNGERRRKTICRFFWVALMHI